MSLKKEDMNGILNQYLPDALWDLQDVMCAEYCEDNGHCNSECPFCRSDELCTIMEFRDDVDKMFDKWQGGANEKLEKCR